MDMFSNLALGLSVALSPHNLAYVFFGVVLGKAVGVLPGIGALVALSLLLPITFYLDPTSSVVMLAGVYYGATYGGSVASILLNIPGTPTTAVTCIDGYPMARQGRAGVALLVTTLASFFGASIGILIMTVSAPIISSAALEFGPSEYFSIMVLGLVAASSAGIGSPIKGISMVLFGLLLGTIGADLETGISRFTFGVTELYDGLSLVALAMGLFGVTEVIYSVRAPRIGRSDLVQFSFRAMLPTRADWHALVKPLLRGSAIGSFFGALPGTGSSIAAFIAYAVEKRSAKDPSRFGKGAIEGIVAPEAANNAADQTAFIPTMTLGIPGNVVMALIIGALTIHGITPGPQIMTKSPELFWGVLMSFWIGNLILLFISIPLISLWTRILLVPYQYLFPGVLVFVCIGAYSVSNNPVAIFFVAVFGFIGYVMRYFGLQAAPLLLGFVLGPLMEENFRRAMLLSRGDFSTFVTQPISAVFLAFSIVLLIRALIATVQRSRRPISSAQQK